MRQQRPIHVKLSLPPRREGREAMQELLPRMKIRFTRIKCEKICFDLSVFIGLHPWQFLFRALRAFAV
jgi:hypothetical protein